MRIRLFARAGSILESTRSRTSSSHAGLCLSLSFERNSTGSELTGPSLQRCEGEMHACMTAESAWVPPWVHGRRRTRRTQMHLTASRPVPGRGISGILGAGIPWHSPDIPPAFRRTHRTHRTHRPSAPRPSRNAPRDPPQVLASTSLLCRLTPGATVHTWHSAGIPPTFRPHSGACA